MPAQQITPDKAVAFMTKYPEEYENYVLSALLRREDIFMTHHTWVCQDPRYPGRFFNDFDDVINYYLFRLMYIKYTEFGTIEVPTEESLRAGLFLIEMKYNKPLLSESQLPDVYAKLKKLTGPDAVSDADIDNLVEPAITQPQKSRRKIRLLSLGSY